MEDKPKEKDCLTVELVSLPQEVKQCNDANCLTLNKLNKLNNIDNLNKLNTTSILGTPKNKVEELFFYLYDHGEQTPQIIEKAIQIPLRTLYTYKTREEENIISIRKGEESFYDISPECRERLDLRIKQKLRILNEKEEAEEVEENNLKSLEELTQEIKNVFQDKTILKREGLDIKELQEQQLEIFNRLETDPEKTLEIFNSVLDDSCLKKPLRLINFGEIFNARSIDSLRSKDLNQLILIECRSSNISDVRPQIINMRFECPACGSILSVLQFESKIREPSRCSCGRRGGFKELSRELRDRAKVELEDLSDLTESPQVKSISAFVYDPLTGSKEISKLNPGNELRVLGIFKSVEKEVKGGKGTALDVFIDILEVEEFEPEINLSNISTQEIQKFEELSKDINEQGLDRIIKSFAPSVEGYEIQKESLVIQSAQGRNKKGSETRNKSNILNVGDPGVAKSVMAKFVVEITPGSSYVSASGASQVGLTATAEKKDEGWILKPGVLPTTKEIAVIDELNLMGEEERPKLQEGMSEGYITINKASIHTKLRVSCGILACANPRRGVFDDGESFVNQFNLTPQLLNRFDLIFVLRDKQNTERDKKIAEKMVEREQGNIKPEFDVIFLKKFFSYIRNQSEPTITEETKTYIPDLYSKTRLNNSQEEGKLINPRLIESLIRLAKGNAKLRMSKTIDKKDIDVAFKLISNSYLKLNKFEGFK